MSKGRVLVTGADGFIGSHLVERLLASGFEVRAFVYYNSFGHWGWLDSLADQQKDALDVFMGDIRDPNGVREAVQGCDFICHLAALIGIPYSYHSPDAYVDTNVRGTLNVMQAARAHGVRRVISTSTSEVYGTAQTVPINESHPLQGQSPYSATKIAADQIAWSFYCSFQTPAVILRPFNTIGPRQSARAVIPTIISQIASGMREISLGALSPTRDFTYVTDTARGFEAALLASDAVHGETINLGTNWEISIGDLVQEIATLMEVDVQVKADAERLRPEKSEVQRLLADNSKAARLMGWKPELAGREGLREALRKTIAWFQEPENLRSYKVNRYTV